VIPTAQPKDSRCFHLNLHENRSGPLIQITPTPAEYEQLVRDLDRLRALGHESNTAIVVEAVRALAERRTASPETE
jgi:hypothetical protein